jgi:hypothetical protein
VVAVPEIPSPRDRTLSKHAAYVPKHRGAVERPLTEVPRRAVKATLLLSALAVAGTGTAVVGGVALSSPGHSTSTQAADAAATVPAASTAGVQGGSAGMSGRRESVSRSFDRQALDKTKAAALGALGKKDTSVAAHTEHTQPPQPAIPTGDPKAIAESMLGSYGWDSSQFGCLVNLWNKESGWNPHAENASSGAYGIPQSLPGSKMASAGADWQTNPATQIKWGLGYIRDSYGSPCGAWSHSESSGWY